LGIKVYTIGVGSEEESPTTMNGRPALQRHEIDVTLLQEIAKRTSAQFFMATDAEALVNIYNTIDQLEKTKLRTDSFEQMDDRYELFAFAGLGFLLLEFFGALTRFRRIP